MGVEKVESVGLGGSTTRQKPKGRNCRKPGDPRFRDLDMKTGLVTNHEGFR